MATATIAPWDGTLDSGNIQIPIRGTISPDLLTGGVSVATGATLEIQCEGNDDIEIYMVGTGASIVTLQAGDYPPAATTKGTGVAYTVPVADVLKVTPEAARHVRVADGSLVAMDGSIIAAVTGTGPVLFWVFRQSGGFVGVPITNRRTIPDAPSDI